MCMTTRQLERTQLKNLFLLDDIGYSTMSPGNHEPSQGRAL